MHGLVSQSTVYKHDYLNKRRYGQRPTAPRTFRMAGSKRAFNCGAIIAGAHDARTETDVSGSHHMAKVDSRAREPPVLFHKVNNESSIIALAVSEARLFAGTQSGEILVRPSCFFLKQGFI